MLRLHHPARSGGFTLVEAMIVVLIVAILLGVGIPGFREAFATQRVKTAAKTLFTALRQARSEAMRMNGLCDVYVVPDDAGDWAAGLQIIAAPVGSDATTVANIAADPTAVGNECVFTDNTATGNITYKNPIAVFSEQEYVNGTPAVALANIRYNRLGRPSPTGVVIPQINFCDDGGLAQSRWSVSLGVDGLPQYASGGAC